MASPRKRRLKRKMILEMLQKAKSETKESEKVTKVEPKEPEVKIDPKPESDAQEKAESEKAPKAQQEPEDKKIKEDASEDEEDLEELGYFELKEVCKNRGLDTKGKKHELLERLKES